MSLSTVALHLNPRPAVAQADRRAVEARPARFDSRALLRGDREILIEHAGETYRLRHTRNDKLILTK